MHITRKTTSPLLNRVRKIGGQVKAIDKAVDAGKELAAILQLVARRWRSLPPASNRDRATLRAARAPPLRGGDADDRGRAAIAAG